jgi:hypothetical protein
LYSIVPNYILLMFVVGFFVRQVDLHFMHGQSEE